MQFFQIFRSKRGKWTLLAWVISLIFLGSAMEAAIALVEQKDVALKIATSTAVIVSVNIVTATWAGNAACQLVVRYQATRNPDTPAKK